ncbi:tRNA pseudouridine(55) synthase TruB, partial [Mycobacterium tuberculosis]|nr:tRNA pseudouridine(55) synthase TruB [Mycobacterium tuberculosis]
VERMVTLEQLQALVDEAAAQDVPAAQLLDPLLMPMDSPASDYPLVNIPETSAVYFKNGNPVRQSGAPLNGLVRVMESESGKFLGMGEIDDEGRVAPRRLVVEYPA